VRLLLALALLAAAGLAGDDALRADWVAKDLEMVARVRGAVDEQDAAALFEKLGAAEAQEDRAIGFGARRKTVAVYGGYMTARVVVVVFESKVAAIEARFDGGDTWTAAAPKVLAAWGGAPQKLPHGFTHARLDDELLARHRAAIEARLGPNERKFDLPKDLRDAYLTLVSPLASYDFGESCGFAGLKPEGRKAVEALLAAKRPDLVRRALRGPNPEGRVYAAQALLRSETRPSAEDRAAIAAIRALDVPIRCCDGCEVSSAPASKLLPESK